MDLNKINIDITKPRYDQTTYMGRARHFFQICNPKNMFVTSARLEAARSLVIKYRNREPIPDHITEEDLWQAKVLYDSAFHPDTGEKMNLFGRMSAQVPCNMLITGAMMTFYKTTSAVLFWQWFNQSFNALVNFTNRSGDAKQSNTQLLTSYVCATTGAVGTAIGLNKLAQKGPPIAARLVPLAAITAANCINIPMMRIQEIMQGTPVMDEDLNKLGYSKKAAKIGIACVIISRVAMAIPGMTLTPIVAEMLEKRGTFRMYPWANLPFQVLFCGFCLVFATPMGCAIFPQMKSIAFNKLEPEVQAEIKQKHEKVPQYVIYNKGL